MHLENLSKRRDVELTANYGWWITQSRCNQQHAQPVLLCIFSLPPSVTVWPIWSRKRAESVRLRGPLGGAESERNAALALGRSIGLEAVSFISIPFVGYWGATFSWSDVKGKSRTLLDLSRFDESRADKKAAFKKCREQQERMIKARLPTRLYKNLVLCR